MPIYSWYENPVKSVLGDAPPWVSHVATHLAEYAKKHKALPSANSQT